MVTATDASVAALPDLASYISALDPVVAAWGALPANKASVLDTATQAITDLNGQATQAWSRPYSRPNITVKNAQPLIVDARPVCCCTPCTMTAHAARSPTGMDVARLRCWCVCMAHSHHTRKSSHTHGAG